MLRPQVVRKTHRGEISWAGERYALEALGNFHGKQVRVAYDVRDSSRIWVRTMAGEMIGEAKLNGNSSDYIAPSIIEQGYVKQAKGQFKQTVAKLESLTGKRVELVAEPVVDYSQAQLTAARQHAVRLAAPSHDQFKLPSDSMSRYRLWQRLNARQQAGESLSEEEALWHQHYPKHPDYQAIRRVFEHAMPAR
nr:Mu transposase C-terminal domain-containing protein [Pseudomonas sp. B329]